VTRATGGPTREADASGDFCGNLGAEAAVTVTIVRNTRVTAIEAALAA
jgi:hypothetical protein